MSNYKKSEWLNPDESPSTGSVTAFDGEMTCNGKKIHNSFLSVSDCYYTVRLHPTEDETTEDFIAKLTKLRDVVDGFIGHLQSKGNGDGSETEEKVPKRPSHREIYLALTKIHMLNDIMDKFCPGLYVDGNTAHTNRQKLISKVESDNRWDELWDYMMEHYGHLIS